MRITAQDLLDLKVIDGIIPEPEGGAHRSPVEAIHSVGEQIARALVDLLQMTPDQLRQQRREKYLAIGREFVN
jgi:acetyl-CoA carboxylase carboxyl transferase subunit alpha